MTETIDLLGIGNAINDNLCRSSDDELKKNGLIKGSMALIDGQKAAELQSTVSPVSRQSGVRFQTLLFILLNWVVEVNLLGRLPMMMQGRTLSMS